MSAPASPLADRLTRSDFHRFFAGKYVALLRAALDPAQRRPDYRDPAVIADIAAGYATLPRPPVAPTPRTIFILWQQGWDSAPPLVRACAASWQRLNPGWDVRLLDDTNLPGLAPALAGYSIPHASRPARSDIVRLELLARHGGVWVDATLFATRPLDDFLPIGPGRPPFAFSYPRPYRLVDVWLLAAGVGSEIVSELAAMSRRYWALFARPHHYYWLPYLLEMLLERRPDLATDYLAAEKLSALGPLMVGGNPFDRDAPRAVFDLIEANTIPVHKLSHKWRFDGPLGGTPLGALSGLETL